jgi:hypothetical protein
MSAAQTPAALGATRLAAGSHRQTARLGFMPQDKRTLLADLNLPDKWRTVIKKFPLGMWSSIWRRRLVYLNRTLIAGKQHYNPPREILGSADTTQSSVQC